MYARSNALATYLPDRDLGLPSPLHPSRSEEGSCLPSREAQISAGEVNEVAS